MPVSALRTLIVGAPPTVYGVALAQPMLRWPMAEPAEVLDYSLDVSALLADAGGDTIASASIAVAPSGAGEMTIAALTVSGGVITAWPSGGVPGRVYQLQVSATTASGRAFVWLVGLPIDAWRATFPLVAPPSAGFGTAATWTSGAVVVGPPVLSLVSTGLVATGTNQATALPLAALTNVFASVPAGTGGKLPANLTSGTIVVLNTDVPNLLIYPPANATIGAAAVNVPVIVSSGQRVSFVTGSGTTWFAA